MRSIVKDQSGTVIALFALSLPVVLTAIGVAVDYSDLVRKRTSLQSAADDAALASTKVLALSGAATPPQKETEARIAAEKIINDRAAGSGRTIAPSSASRTVEVTLTLDKPTFFGALYSDTDVALRVTARATYSAPAPAACIIAVGQDDDAGIHLIGSAKINAPQCGVWSNCVGAGRAAKITARNVCGVGGVGSASSSPPAKSQCDIAEDPYKSRPRRCGRDLSSTNCTVYKITNSDGGSGKGGKSGSSSGIASSYTGKCDYTNYSVDAEAKGRVILKPGVYCGGLSIHGADVQLAPGFYQVQDGPLHLQANASLSGTGVSILLSGANAVLDLQGSPSLTLSAMTTGTMAGIAIASDTPAEPPLVSCLQGSPDISLTGSLRLPGQVLKMQGSPKLTLNGATDKAIAYSFDLHGSPDLINKANDSAEQVAGASNLRLVK